MKYRVLLFVLSIGIALGLVSFGLSAASASRAGVTTAGIELQPAGLQDQPVSVQSSSYPPGWEEPMGSTGSYPHPTDTLGEQMRLQAMQASPGKISQLADIYDVSFWNNKFGRTTMWGTAEPGSTIDVLTSRGYTLTTVTDPGGDFGFDSSIDIFSGDVVTVSKRGGSIPVVIAIHDPLDVYADSANQTVFGHVGDWAQQQVGIFSWWGEPYITVTTDLDGNFVSAFTNMPRGARGHIILWEKIGETGVGFNRPYYDLELLLNVNSTNVWINSDYEVGTQIWITVTNDLGEVKATAYGKSSPVPWWGDNTGFSTDFNVPWDGPRPDLQFGDWVYVKGDNGRTGEVHIGEITGNLDVNVDLLTGNLNIPWLTDPVSGGCDVWVSGGTGLQFDNVDPHGGSFTCDFSTIPYDLQAGMDIAVDYRDPQGNKIFAVFRQPAPNLWINTWGNNDPAQGGNYELMVEYNNDGEATAQGVVISQTLINGMVYLGDTSGFSHTGDGTPGNPLNWSLGDLPVSNGYPHRFQVFLQVTASAGETIAEAIQIDTTTPYYQGDKNKNSNRGYWEGKVVDNNTYLNIGKGAWTGDPAPGTDFVYNVNVCNKGKTASTQVIMTDSLPLATTLVDWWGQNRGWQEISHTAHQLVVSRPTVQGWWCGEVYIQVRLNENAWGSLRNQAWVWASNDLDPNDNYTAYDHGVGSPHINLALRQNWIFGQFVPGGEIVYEFNYANTGNMPVEGILVTETLPVNTSFSHAYSWDAEGQIYPITPTIITPGYLVWDIGTLMNGFQKSLSVWLTIDPQALPGTILIHTAEISPQPLEDRYDDNILQSIEKINDFGPNLRVDKSYYQWNDWWDGNQQRYQLQYELHILNLGSQLLENVWITDTYPVTTTFDSWWQNHGPWITMTHDPGNHLIKFWVERLNPGETASIGFRLEVPTQYIDVQGLTLPNQLDAPIPGDVDPADNHQVVTAHNGPDIFARKWLSGGIPKPGELITFTVEFGNANRWPWSSDQSYGSHITETLPAGMSLVKIIGHGNPQNTWVPETINGNTIVWHWGPMGSEQAWTFDLVARIDDDLPGGQTLYNQVEAYGDSPYDVDYNLENNAFALPVEIIPFAGVELTPTSQADTAKPGESAVYTFTLTNTGDIQDAFAITVNGGFVYSLSAASSGPLQPGATFVFTLTVMVPPGAVVDSQDDAVISVQSAFDSQVESEAHVFTTVGERAYFIAVIIKSNLP